MPSQGGLIVASNHIANPDPFLVGSAVPRELWFMAKKELFKPPIMGKIISRLNAFPVDRFKFDRNVIKKSLQILKEGKALIMFPEGTRSKDGEIHEGKIGVGMLAKKANVPIVPVYVENSQKAWLNLKRAKRLKIIIGRLIEAEWIKSRQDSKSGYREITEEVMNRIRSLRQTACDRR